METLGSRLKKIRKSLELTQRQLAKEVGVSSASVVQWEKDVNEPRGNNADLLCKRLGVDWSFLRDGETNSSKQVSNTIDKIQAEDIFCLYQILSLEDIESPQLESAYNNAAVKGHKSVSMVVPQVYKSDKTALITDLGNGMAPMINDQDRVLINCTIKPNPMVPAIFLNANKEAALGFPERTPSGIFLRFLNNSSGWEPVKVQSDNYIGSVIQIDPYFAYSNREQDISKSNESSDTVRLRNLDALY